MAMTDAHFLALVPRALANTVRLPISKLKEALASCHRRWGCSLLRIMVGEVYRLPLRMAAILRNEDLRFGPELPPSPFGRNLESFYPLNNFVLSCNEDIQQLRGEFAWCGDLEAQLCHRAFQLGARW